MTAASNQPAPKNTRKNAPKKDAKPNNDDKVVNSTDTDVETEENLVTPADLAKQFNVPGSTIRRILRAKYKHGHAHREKWTFLTGSTELEEVTRILTESLEAAKAPKATKGKGKTSKVEDDEDDEDTDEDDDEE